MHLFTLSWLYSSKQHRFYFALAATFVGVQAQDDAKSVDGENKTEQPALDKDATNKSDTSVDSTSNGSSTRTNSSGGNNTLSTPPATPVDTTRKDRKPEDK